MHKLAEILHELISGAAHLSPNRRAELHALADDAVAVLPEPEKAAAEVVADVAAPGMAAAAMKSAEVVANLVQAAKEKAVAADGAAGA